MAMDLYEIRAQVKDSPGYVPLAKFWAASGQDAINRYRYVYPHDGWGHVAYATLVTPEWQNGKT